jgi:hypothetical protein
MPEVEWKLSDPARVLLERVKAIHEMGSGHYALGKGEQRAAAELVDRGLCFYHMGYDRIAAYRNP